MATYNYKEHQLANRRSNGKPAIEKPRSTAKNHTFGLGFAGIYNFTGKPSPGTFKTTHDKSVQFFSPQGMARAGIR